MLQRYSAKEDQSIDMARHSHLSMQRPDAMDVKDSPGERNHENSFDEESLVIHHEE